MRLMSEIRGFRNNNPGNIRHGEKWLGLSLIQTDKAFCQFESVEYGIRAIFKILETYQNKYDTKTIETMIQRWAPPCENNTTAYIDAVSKRAWLPSHEIVAPDELYKIVDGIIHQESGHQPFNITFISNCRDIKK